MTRHPLAFAMMAFEKEDRTKFREWLDYYQNNLEIYESITLATDIHFHLMLSFDSSYLEDFLESRIEYSYHSSLKDFIIPLANLNLAKDYRPTGRQLRYAKKIESYRAGKKVKEDRDYLAIVVYEAIINNRLVTNPSCKKETHLVYNNLLLRGNHLANIFREYSDEYRFNGFYFYIEFNWLEIKKYSGKFIYHPVRGLYFKSVGALDRSYLDTISIFYQRRDQWEMIVNLAVIMKGRLPKVRPDFGKTWTNRDRLLENIFDVKLPYEEAIKELEKPIQLYQAID